VKTLEDEAIGDIREHRGREGGGSRNFPEDFEGSMQQLSIQSFGFLSFEQRANTYRK